MKGPPWAVAEMEIDFMALVTNVPGAADAVRHVGRRLRRRAFGKPSANAVDKKEGNSTRRSITIPMAFLSLALLVSGHAGAQESSKFEIFDPSKFDRSTTIDNKWLPMTPGMRWVYEGTTVEDDGEAVPHRIEIHVTDLTKVISGVRTVVSYDLDFTDGELKEAELAFYAQDNDGNVWRFGEYPEDYADGKIVDAPAWIDGFEGARAGIMMLAQPQLDSRSYAQGWGPAVNWTDRGKVHQMGLTTAVAAGSYEDVLVVAESSEIEIDALQLKYYAPGIGNVRVGWSGDGEKTKETLELVKVERLNPDELADVRAKALQLEQSAYKNSKNVYARTPASFRSTNGTM